MQRLILSVANPSAPLSCRANNMQVPTITLNAILTTHQMLQISLWLSSKYVTVRTSSLASIQVAASLNWMPNALQAALQGLAALALTSSPEGTSETSLCNYATKTLNLSIKSATELSRTRGCSITCYSRCCSRVPAAVNMPDQICFINTYLCTRQQQCSCCEVRNQLQHGMHCFNKGFCRRLRFTKYMAWSIILHLPSRRK